MNLFRLAARNITGSAFRSWVVFLCALIVSALALSTYLIVHGARDSLQLAAARMGADLMVVPDGTETRVETALLMGHPIQVWMPTEKLTAIAAIPGVAQASPQLYLSSLKGASCCSVSEMFLVVYDPLTDFTIQPWLLQNLGRPLKLGESVGGTYVFVPEGEPNIKLYGYFLTLMGNLEPTGTNLDQSMFLNLDTAQDMARISVTQAEQPLVIPQDSISAVLLKVQPGVDPHDVAVRIMQQVPGVTPIESPNLFRSQKQQIGSLLMVLAVLIVITLVLSLALIAFVFAMAANERRREIGVLRALGATRGFIFKTLLAEAGLLAVAGALPGSLLAIFCVYLFRNLIIQSLAVPFILPTAGGLLTALAAGLLLALLGVGLAASIPALHISRLEPALAMRE
jgi:putative ABC transport system permease protein